ncbi:uncharacterized protein LOC134254109 [Saccostrea cucullata]|uniref:uncharacterized protein LOC134254109 n=1 Tax=Saccostrea cuccullata TaxID=36930 RepID=UPI002ED22FFE
MILKFVRRLDPMFVFPILVHQSLAKIWEAVTHSITTPDITVPVGTDSVEIFVKKEIGHVIPIHVFLTEHVLKFHCLLISFACVLTIEKANFAILTDARQIHAMILKFVRRLDVCIPTLPAIRDEILVHQSLAKIWEAVTHSIITPDITVPVGTDSVEIFVKKVFCAFILKSSK